MSGRHIETGLHIVEDQYVAGLGMFCDEGDKSHHVEALLGPLRGVRAIDAVNRAVVKRGTRKSERVWVHQSAAAVTEKSTGAAAKTRAARARTRRWNKRRRCTAVSSVHTISSPQYVLLAGSFVSPSLPRDAGGDLAGAGPMTGRGHRAR